MSIAFRIYSLISWNRIIQFDEFSRSGYTIPNGEGIMRVPAIYLETTVFSFYYGSEATPEYKQYKADSRSVFDLIKASMRLLLPHSPRTNWPMSLTEKNA
jgi:hypothetical protein